MRQNESTCGGQVDVVGRSGDHSEAVGGKVVVGQVLPVVVVGEVVNLNLRDSGQVFKQVSH